MADRSELIGTQASSLDGSSAEARPGARSEMNSLTQIKLIRTDPSAGAATILNTRTSKWKSMSDVLIIQSRQLSIGKVQQWQQELPQEI